MQWHLNRNGSSAASILKQHECLLNALPAVEEALKGIMVDALHGRQYQTVENADAAQKADKDDLIAMMVHIAEMRAYALSGACRIVRQREQL